MLEWLRRTINDGTEKGSQQWAQLIEWVNTPPVTTHALAPAEPSRAASLRAAAEAAVGREDTAFDAYAGALGR